MQDLLLASITTGALFFLTVFVSSALVAQHTKAAVPKLLAGLQVPRAGRRSLIVTLPWVITILGGGQVVVALFLAHPASTIAVRVVSGAELAAAGVWTWYLWKRVSRRT